MENPSQIVTDSDEEVVKKKNKCVAKKKWRFAKLGIFVGSSLSFHPKFSSFLLFCSMPALMHILVPALIPTFMPAFISHFRSLAVLLSCHIPAPISHLGSLIVLLSRHASIFYCRILAFLSLVLSILGQSLLFKFSSFRIFKWSLSNEPWLRMSTSPAKSFRPFLALGTYNQTNKNKRKRGFTITFINFYPLIGNHD